MVDFIDTITNQIISYHIDPKLLKIWDSIKDGKLEKMNEDRVYIVDGRERTGKSSFTFQQAKYIDPTFNIDRICFEPEDFLFQLKNAPRGSVIVFDEAFRGLSSKSNRSKVNKAIVEGLMEMGQRNLVVFIVMPTIFLLEIYAAVFRTEALFHIKKTEKKNMSGVKQRIWKMYNYRKKKELYLRGKVKHFSYAQPKIMKQKGKFFVKRRGEITVPYETFDIDAYNKKKEVSFRKSHKEEDEPTNKYLVQRDLIIKGMYKDHIKSLRKLSAWLDTVGLPLGYRQIANIVGESSEKA